MIVFLRSGLPRRSFSEDGSIEDKIKCLSNMLIEHPAGKFEQGHGHVSEYGIGRLYSGILGYKLLFG